MTIRELLLSSVLLFGCGGSTPAAGTPSQAAPAAQGDESSKKVVFRELSLDRKREYMLTVVTPRMRQAFQAVDPERYAKMNCATCHGPSARQGNFKMPNPNLPALDPENGFAKHAQQTPAVLKFMMEKVVPEMANLLGTPAYDAKTHQGFGCFNCHVKSEK